MTSRRKAKRVPWVEHTEWKVVHPDGSLTDFAWEWPWYFTAKRKDKYLRHNDPQSMFGCVKRAKQQKHRGSWNRIGVDPEYRLGYRSWKQD